MNLEIISNHVVVVEKISAFSWIIFCFIYCLFFIKYFFIQLLVLLIWYWTIKYIKYIKYHIFSRVVRIYKFSNLPNVMAIFFHVLSLIRSLVRNIFSDLITSYTKAIGSLLALTACGKNYHISYKVYSLTFLTRILYCYWM